MEEIKKNFWLENFDCFSISGKDAKKFLNGITTGNIIKTDNKVFKTCWLTPNGVLRALFEINFLDDKLEVIILEGNKKEILDYFNKIIFPSDDVFLSSPFSKYRFQEVDEINSWRINEPIFLENGEEEYQSYKKHQNLLNPDELKMWKIKQAIPSLDNEINGKNNPLELGLSDLIDFNKGCYLGQETMSKIKNFSSLQKEIRVWSTFDSIFNFESEDKNLYKNPKKDNIIGKITSFYKLDSQIKGLAMIKRKNFEIENEFYSEIFGRIRIYRSSGSIFI